MYLEYTLAPFQDYVGSHFSICKYQHPLGTRD